jgi:hypothetical protein
MVERDWKTIDAVVNELDELISFRSLPGNHPDAFQAVERITRVLDRNEIAVATCAELRTFARAFYADKSRRRRAMSKVEFDHDRMMKCVVSIQTHVMLFKRPN